MDDNGILRIDAHPAGKNGTALLKVWRGDEVLAVDKVDLAMESARSGFAVRLHDRFPGIDVDAVEAELLKTAGESLGRRDEKTTGAPATARDLAALSAEALAKTPEVVRFEAKAMLESPNLVDSIANDVAAVGVAGEQDLALTLYLLGISRLLDKPLATIVQGPSSSGKSFLIDKIASLFPPETVVRATQMTPQALFHMKPGSLRNCFVAAGERLRADNSEAADATRALREMISAGRLTKLMPMKIGGEIQTVLIEQEGPIAFAESTTSARIFEEDLNRCLLLSTDERSDQTARIVRSLASDYEGATRREMVDQTLARHHAMQRMLRQHRIVIPFAQRLAELMPHDQVEIRRVFPQLMSMIQSAALLNQSQRPLDVDGRLVAKADDYRLAHRLLAKPVARVLGRGLTDGAQRFFERLRGWFGNTDFTTPEATKNETNSRSSVYGWTHELHEYGLIDLIQPQAGTRPAVWRLRHIDMVQVISALPSPEDLFQK